MTESGRPLTERDVERIAEIASDKSAHKAVRLSLWALGIDAEDIVSVNKFRDRMSFIDRQMEHQNSWWRVILSLVTGVVAALSGAFASWFWGQHK